MMRLALLLSVLSLLLPAARAQDAEETAALRLIREFAADPSRRDVALRIFNDHQSGLEKAAGSKRLQPADWARLRKAKLDILSGAIEDFLVSQKAPKGGAYVTRMDHMGTSGTRTAYTPTSDADLRPNHMYKGIEGDFAKIAEKHGIRSMQQWGINLLGPTDATTPESFLRAMRNPEKYPLEGALKFLDYNQYSKNFTEALQVDASGEPVIRDGKPVFRGRIRMTGLGHMRVTAPTALDAADYMVEMYTRARMDLREMKKLGRVSPDDMAQMKRLRKFAKDLYKYAGTRAVGEALGPSGISLESLPPDLRERLKRYAQRAPQIKQDLARVGNDPVRILAEAERLVKDTEALLGEVLRVQADNLAKRFVQLPRNMTPEQARQNLDLLRDLVRFESRFAIQSVRGGDKVFDILVAHLQDHPELIKDIESLRTYLNEEFWKTTNTLTPSTEYLRRWHLARVRREAADRFLRNVLARLQEKRGGDIGPLQEPARIRLRRSKPTVPGRNIRPRGAARIYAAHAKRCNDKISPQIDKSPGCGKVFIPRVHEVLRDLAEWRGRAYGELLNAKLPELELHVSKEMARTWLKGLLEFERSSVLHSVKGLWQSMPALDRNLIVHGRSMVREMVRMETPSQAIHKLFLTLMIWDIAYATYPDGWDGFILTTGTHAGTMAKWGLITVMFDTVAPAILNKFGQTALAQAAPVAGQALSIALVAEAIIQMGRSGIDVTVEYFFTGPWRDEQVFRFYEYHTEGSPERREGFGFFDPGRTGYGLTPQSLFSGSRNRRGYPTPKALLTAIRTHRSKLVQSDLVARVRTHGKGLRIWYAIENRALHHWYADLLRTQDRIKRFLTNALGTVDNSDIEKDVLLAAPPDKPVFIRVAGAAVASEQDARGWIADVETVLLVAAMPGTGTTIKVKQEILGTELTAEDEVLVRTGTSVDPRDLISIERPRNRFSFERPGIYTNRVTILDKDGRTLLARDIELGVGSSGVIRSLDVSYALTRDGPAVREVRPGETAFVRARDTLTGFQTVEKKVVTAWLEDAENRLVSGLSAEVTVKKETNPAVLVLVVPDSFPPGDYTLKVQEQVRREKKTVGVPFRVVRKDLKITGVRCIVSKDPAGTPATRVFLRGDPLHLRVELNAEHVPPGMTADVKWLLTKPVKPPVAWAPETFALEQGANGYTSSEPSKLGETADPGTYRVTATLSSGGKTHTAHTTFKVEGSTLRIHKAFTTYKLDLDRASARFAPGETVWAKVLYEVSGPPEVEQRVRIVWVLTAPDGTKTPKLEDVVLRPGKYKAASAWYLPRPGNPGRYVLEVTLRAERQKGLTRRLLWELKKPVEWSEPGFVIGADKDALVDFGPFRVNETIHYVLRYRVNVENGRTVGWRIKIRGPEGEAGDLGARSRPAPAKISRWIGRGKAAIPSAQKEGRYLATVEITWGDEKLVKQKWFEIRHPAKIDAMTVLERRDSNRAKTRFKQGEDFGVYIGYSLQHLRETDKQLSMKLQLRRIDGGKVIWSESWGPVEPRAGKYSKRAGARFDPWLTEGAYVFTATLKLDRFVCKCYRQIRVVIYPTVTIVFPRSGFITDQRVIMVTGGIADLRIKRAKIDLNGQAKSLAVRKGIFREKMVLRPGRNVITVTAKNRLFTDTKSVTIQANIRAAVLKVVLDWNTDKSDVDLWVVDPEGVCTWYRNQNPPQGRRNLDIDNTAGYGPETYTIFKPLRGVYTITIKYYRDRGAGPTRARVHFTTWEATAREGRGVKTGVLTRAAGDREVAGSFFKFHVRVH